MALLLLTFSGRQPGNWVGGRCTWLTVHRTKRSVTAQNASVCYGPAMSHAAVATRKGRRRRRKPSVMGRSLLWIVGISGIALVVILCIRIFGDSSTAYNRAMSDCISSHTQDKETLSGEEARAIGRACANAMGQPGAQ